MDKKQKILAYMQMPEATLLQLISRNHRKSYLIKKAIRNDWVKNKKCECSKANVFQSGKCVLRCYHISNEWQKATAEIDGESFLQVQCLCLRSLKRRAYNN